MIINKKTAINSITEVNQIINILKNEDKNKIPVSVKSFFSKYSSNDIIIDHNKSLCDQNISDISKVMLKYIYNYINR